MATVKFNSAVFPRERYESVLDCLLRHRQSVPYACKAGMCQACLVKAVDCEATGESKKWIRKSLQARGYTLACQWVPEGDVQVSLPMVEEFSIPVSILGLDRLNERVIRLRLRVEEKEVPAGTGMFHYYPGQYLSLINPRGIARSYSIANDYEQEGCIELHIGSTSRGSFTGWLFREALAGDRLHIRGPAGDCFYPRGDGTDYPILLAGTGTGLAPLYGIARDALAQGHRGPLTLVHGARAPGLLYYTEELLALQEKHANFHYRPAVMENAEKAALPGLSLTPADQLALEQLDPEAVGRTRIYLCGEPDFVHGLRKKVFLKGARPGNIFTDPFIERTVVPTPV